MALDALSRFNDWAAGVLYAGSGFFQDHAQPIQPLLDSRVKSVKRSGRPPLPDGMRQTEMIRERVTRAQREAYRELGGKAWLIAMLENGFRQAGPEKGDPSVTEQLPPHCGTG